MRNFPEQPPPHNLEAEQAVLGAMMIDPTARQSGLAQLAPDAFYPTCHRLVFSAIAALRREGRPTDLIVVTDWLRDAGQLEEAGGAAYVTQLLEGVFSTALFDHYASIVRRDWLRRDTCTVLDECAHRARNSESPDDLLGEAREKIEALSLRNSGRALEAVSVTDLLADKTPAPSPLVEGFIFPQTITLLAGPTKTGKTQLALQLASAVVTGKSFLGLTVPQPSSALYVGQEDSYFTLRDRLRGLDQRFGPPQAPFHALPAKGLLLERGGEIRQLVAVHRPGLLILDPLRRFHEREEEKGEMSLVIRQVDLLIRDYQLAVLVVHHMRKLPTDRGKRRPEVSDVRGSSVITDQANTIALLAEDSDEGTFLLTVSGNYVERRTLRLQRQGWVFERRGTNEALSSNEALGVFAEHPPHNRKEAVQLLMQVGLSQASAYRQVKRLEEEGILAQSNGHLTVVRERLGRDAGFSFGP